MHAGQETCIPNGKLTNGFLSEKAEDGHRLHASSATIAASISIALSTRTLECFFSSHLLMTMITSSCY